MNIRIDDDVPIPQPDKPSTWVSVSTPSAKDDGWIKEAFLDPTPKPNVVEVTWHNPPIKRPLYARPPHCSLNRPQRYPAETTYDAKGVPTVDCFLVGGPLNGRHGPVVGTLKTVELEVYAADGSVQSVELYELGAKGDLGGRYWAGTKGKQQCSLCKDWFAIGIVNDSDYCAECWSQIKT